VKASDADVELAVRRDGGTLYVLAARRSATQTSRVRFTGLPASVHGGEVLEEYVQQKFRAVAVARGAFSDWLGPHDVRVYRFAPA
jgi:hypothetical protein